MISFTLLVRLLLYLDFDQRLSKISRLHYSIHYVREKFSIIYLWRFYYFFLIIFIMIKLIVTT